MIVLMSACCSPFGLVVFILPHCCFFKKKGKKVKDKLTGSTLLVLYDAIPALCKLFCMPYSRISRVVLF